MSSARPGRFVRCRARTGPTTEGRQHMRAEKAQRGLPHNVDDQAVTAAQSRSSVERTNTAPATMSGATCQTSQNRTFCACCTVHPTRPQDAQSRSGAYTRYRKGHCAHATWQMAAHWAERNTAAGCQAWRSYIRCCHDGSEPRVLPRRLLFRPATACSCPSRGWCGSPSWWSNGLKRRWRKGALTCAWGRRSGRLGSVWGVARAVPLRSCRSAR
jgi:hypothetical protein